MTEPKPALPRKRRELPKNQAIVVMVIGAILLAQVFLFPSEAGSSAQMTRIVVAIMGLVVLLVGAYLRPVKPFRKGNRLRIKKDRIQLPQF